MTIDLYSFWVGLVAGSILITFLFSINTFHERRMKKQIARVNKPGLRIPDHVVMIPMDSSWPNLYRATLVNNDKIVYICLQRDKNGFTFIISNNGNVSSVILHEYDDSFLLESKWQDINVKLELLFG